MNWSHCSWLRPTSRHQRQHALVDFARHDAGAHSGLDDPVDLPGQRLDQPISRIGHGLLCDLFDVRLGEDHHRWFKGEPALSYHPKMHDEINRGGSTSRYATYECLHTYPVDVEPDEALICVTADQIAGEPGPAGTG